MPGRGSILIVDDDATVRSLCERIMQRAGHRVRTAGCAREALDILQEENIDVLVTDLEMPGTSGLELLSEVHSSSPGTRSILMSGRADASDAALAIERGVDRLLLKPFDGTKLTAAVEKALAEKRAQERLSRERAAFEALLSERENESRAWIIRAAHALVAAVEAKDAYTAGHAARVTSYAVAIAAHVPDIDVARLRLAGDLHDVGKIGVPDYVLNKPERLTEHEFELIRRHPGTGARILEPLIDDALVIGAVRSHHERWDGAGYPDGLRGAEIPLSARVLAVADALDAMTSSRAYRDGLPWDVAVAEVRSGGGTQFDAEVVTAFSAALPELAQLHDSFSRIEQHVV